MEYVTTKTFNQNLKEKKEKAFKKGGRGIDLTRGPVTAVPVVPVIDQAIPVFSAHEVKSEVPLPPSFNTPKKQPRRRRRRKILVDPDAVTGYEKVKTKRTRDRSPKRNKTRKPKNLKFKVQVWIDQMWKRAIISVRGDNLIVTISDKKVRGGASSMVSKFEYSEDPTRQLILKLLNSVIVEKTGTSSQIDFKDIDTNTLATALENIVKTY